MAIDAIAQRVRPARLHPRHDRAVHGLRPRSGLLTPAQREALHRLVQTITARTDFLAEEEAIVLLGALAYGHDGPRYATFRATEPHRYARPRCGTTPVGSMNSSKEIRQSRTSNPNMRRTDNSTMDTVEQLYIEERDRFVADLRGLNDEQWATSSLCASWSVRDLTAHLLMPFELTVPGLLRRVIPARFDFDRLADRWAREDGRSGPQLADALAATTEPPRMWWRL